MPNQPLQPATITDALIAELLGEVRGLRADLAERGVTNAPPPADGTPFRAREPAVEPVKKPGQATPKGT